MTAKKTPIAQDKTGTQATVSPEKKEESASKLDNDILQKILDNQKKSEAENKALREVIAEMKAAAKNKSTEPDNSSIDEDTVDDYLDVPVAFFAYNSIFSIHSYKLKGKNLVPPSGAIRFKPTVRYTTGSGMNAKVHAICEHKSHSKKEIKFLESNPDFNVKYFKTMTESKNYNHAYADILSKESIRVGQMSDHAVIAAVCEDPTMNPSKDIKGMRNELIHKRADDSMKSAKERESADLKKVLEDRENLREVMQG